MQCSIEAQRHKAKTSARHQAAVHWQRLWRADDSRTCQMWGVSSVIGCMCSCMCIMLLLSRCERSDPGAPAGGRPPPSFATAAPSLPSSPLP